MNLRRVAVIVLGLLLLAGLYVAFKPTAPPAIAPTPVAGATPAARRFDWRIERGHLVAGNPRLVVSEGEAVILQVTSDHADELHLHGYDLALSLQPGVPATLAFSAARSGRFDIELHHAHGEIGALEVQPRP